MKAKQVGVSWNESNAQTWAKDYVCGRCGRKSSETTLNTEGILHHNLSEVLCIDHVSCRRAAKKKK